MSPFLNEMVDISLSQSMKIYLLSYISYYSFLFSLWDLNNRLQFLLNAIFTNFIFSLILLEIGKVKYNDEYGRAKCMVKNIFEEE